MIASTILRHFLEFFFAPDGKPWYEGAVWGNVVAILPLAVLGTAGYWIHKYFTHEHKRFDAETAHDEHTKHLRAILDALDPEVVSESQLDIIADRVNEETPGGLGTVLKKLEELREAERSRLPEEPPSL